VVRSPVLLILGKKYFRGAFQKAEIEKWWSVIKAANIKGE